MKYTYHFDTIGFYPYKYWFFHFFKFKNINGFKIRIFGLELMIKEENSLSKLIEIARIKNAARNKTT